MANQMFTPMSDNEADALLDELFGSSETVETETATVDTAAEPTVEPVAEMPTEAEAKATDVDLEVVDELPEVTKSVVAGTRHLSKPRVVVNKFNGIDGLSAAESNEFNSWLAAHGLCKTIGAFASTKRMRIYRNLGTKNGKQLHSRDCIYVVSSDDWRKNKEAVYRTILRLSKKQMDAEMVVKVAEYRQKMNQIEEDLLLQHDIVMNWYNGKSATFKKIQHKIMAPDVLAMLDEAVKHNDKYNVQDMYLQRFRMGAQIEELGIAPEYDWRNFDVIVKGGKVVCAYSYRDMVPLYSETFKTGFFNKFGYNTEIVDSETIEKVKAMGAKYTCAEAEKKA
jgi:ribosomal protein S16